MSTAPARRSPGPAATVVALAAGLLVATAFVLGYLPGDARGATRRAWTMQTGTISLVLALVSFLPLRALRWVLVLAAGAFLLLSLAFWLTVGR